MENREILRKSFDQWQGQIKQLFNTLDATWMRAWDDHQLVDHFRQQV